MIKFDNLEVVGWEHAIRGMRNPMNSWEKSDSEFNVTTYWDEECELIHESNQTVLGENDLALMMRLRNAGTDHRKFMRQIVVYLDITAPLYWWKEMDTYKVGTVANSCSTMHKIHAKEFTMDDFSHEHMKPASKKILEETITLLNYWRDCYNLHKGAPSVQKEYWYNMVQLLGTSYNQKRTVMLNYEVLANIYKSRRHHKLDEWHAFCDFIETLPYSELITGPIETTIGGEE